MRTKPNKRKTLKFFVFFLIFIALATGIHEVTHVLIFSDYSLISGISLEKEGIFTSAVISEADLMKPEIQTMMALQTTNDMMMYQMYAMYGFMFLLLIMIYRGD